MNPKLCLGTVQFGLKYGVTNQRGKLTESEIELILLKCQNHGINFIDTAQAYGDAEIVLGRTMPKNNKFEIINKFSDKEKLFKGNPTLRWEKNFKESLKRLNKKSINSLLLHNSSDLLGLNKDLLLGWLKSLKERKLIKRIGLSIYEEKDLSNIPLEEIQIIQLPFSLYDQRLLEDGTIKRLYQLGISIHARSIFLQGLILQPEELWPSFISKGFKKHHAKTFNQLGSDNLSMLEASISFVNNCSYIESFLVGISSFSEFEKIIKTWESLKSKNFSDFNYSKFSWNKKFDLDPRLWKK